MPKSRTRKKNPGKRAGKQIDFGANVGKTSTRTYVISGAVALLMAVGGGYVFWQNQQTSSAVNTLATEGQAALSRVQSPPIQSAGHLSPGQTYNYDERYPTSGRMDPSPLRAGFYDTVQRRTRMMHSMEHGAIIFYYETPGDEAIDLLRDWASLYTGQLQSVIATPSPGLGEAVVMTAWGKSLRLNTFDPAAAAAFMDAFRGRGPEGRVR